MTSPRRFADHRQCRRWLSSLLLAGWCAGCSTLPDLTLPRFILPEFSLAHGSRSDVQTPPSSVGASETDSLTANWDHRLAERLAHPLWKKRPEWTPEKAASDQLTYWTLGIPHTLDSQLSEAQVRSQSPEESTPAISQANRSPEDDSQTVISEDDNYVEQTLEAPGEAITDPLALLGTEQHDSLIASLERLATWEDLPALQALILLAQHNVPLNERQQSRLEEAFVSGFWRPEQLGIDFNFATGRTQDSIPASSKTSLNATTLNDATRAAIAEAWCRSLLTSEQESINPATQLARPGRLLKEALLKIEVQSQLLRSVCAEVTPSRISLMQTLFAPTAGVPAYPNELKQAGIEGCLINAFKLREHSSYNPALWPERIEELENERSSELRKLFGQFVALTGHPSAVEVLRHQLLDTDYAVKAAAISSASRLLAHPEYHDQAVAILKEAASSDSEHLRAASMTGLAQVSLHELRQFLNDPSVKVKQSLIATLGHSPGPQAGQMILQLVTEKNLQVQLACLEATRDWPLEAAQPVWMEAYRAGSLRTRQQAAELSYAKARVPLAHWRDSIDARQREIQQVAMTHQVQTYYQHPEDAAASPQRIAHESLRRDELLEAIHHLSDEDPQNDAQATALLSSIKPHELSIIESSLNTANPTLRQLLQAQILPSALPEFASMQSLTSSDVMTRRAAALDLKHIGEQRTLPEFITAQLPARLKQEYDLLVWRYLMQAIALDARPASHEIACEALRSPWPDIQILGCEYVCRHRTSALASEISHLLQVHDTTVLLAAIAASAATGHPMLIDGIQGTNPGSLEPSGSSLRSLLTHPDRRVRHAVVIALAKLGDTQGQAELIKLSYDLDPRVRTDAIGALRDIGSTDSPPLLVKMLWTERNDQVRSEILQALDQLVPPAQRPESLDTARTLHEKVDSWMAWLDLAHPHAL